MHSHNWDNLRFVLNVVDHGSVSAAARALGVNHATVLRRVAAFEDDHGGAVFERTLNGYRVLPDRENVISAAREVENAVLSVKRLMHGVRAPLRGLVRVSSTDSICQAILPPLVKQLQSVSSELRLDVISTNTHLDFSRLQADISVRPAVKLPDEMTGETSASLGLRAYSTPDARQVWLGMSGPLGRSAGAAWMSENVAEDRIVGGSDSFMVLREMALTGTGIAILPAFLGEPAPGLVHRRDLMPEMSVPVWVATYGELRDVPRIRIVRERILDYLADRRDSLNPAGR